MRGQRRNRLWTHLRPGRGLVLAVSILALTSLLAGLFIGRQLEIARRRRELEDLTVAHATALEERAALRDRLERRNDLDAIETLARGRLGLVLPGEEKVIFVEEGAR